MKTVSSRLKLALALGAVIAGVTAYASMVPSGDGYDSFYENERENVALSVVTKAAFAFEQLAENRNIDDGDTGFNAVAPRYLLQVRARCEDLARFRKSPEAQVSENYRAMLAESVSVCVELGKLSKKRPLIYRDLQDASDQLESSAKARYKQHTENDLALQEASYRRALKLAPDSVTAMASWK